MYSGKSGIKNLSGSIRVSEIPTVAQAMLSHWASSGLAEKCPLLNVGFAELDTLTKSAISTLNSEKSKSSLDDLDRALDEAWTALGTGLEGHFALQKGEKKEAAKTLLDLYSRHGGKSAARLNFASETTTIASALDEFKNDKAKAAIELLGGIGEAVEAIGEAHTAFSQAFNQAAEKNAAGKVSKSSSDLKKEILHCINDKILPFLSAASLLDSATYAPIASVIDEDVSRANSLASKHSSAAKK